jgi:hypothetical protein
MSPVTSSGCARLAGPDIFGIAMRGKLFATGHDNPPQAPSESKTDCKTVDALLREVRNNSMV